MYRRGIHHQQRRGGTSTMATGTERAAILKLYSVVLAATQKSRALVNEGFSTLEVGQICFS